MEIHVQNNNKYQKVPCCVEMAFAIPEDINTHPWAFLWVKGSHAHPPPPPTRTPNRIFKQVSTLMKQHNLLTLTRGESSLVDGQSGTVAN